MSAALSVVELRAGDTIAEPPVPDECDLTGFGYMMLDIGRLTQSKAWTFYAAQQPELGFYMVNLWMRAWHQVPAGSLENDDEMLCTWAGCAPARWPEVRSKVLHGWKLCTANGRLYHLYLCKKVELAWAKSRKQSDQAKAAATARWDAQRAAKAGRAASMPAACPQHAKGDGEGKGDREGDGQESGAPPRLGGASGAGAGEGEPTIRDTLNAEGVTMIQALTGKSLEEAKAFLGTLCQDSGDRDEITLRIIRKTFQAQLSGKGKANPASWLRKVIRDEARMAGKADVPAVASPAGPRAPSQRDMNQATRQFAHFMTASLRGRGAKIIDHEGNA